ncbi:flavin reductase family protein [Candidatus Poriferisocius sp.]|uniref:flavin reductase family protein n=1 Tax=Candidatus Poriferisocius sp. TaxID=3101276 RepID=UPI003B5B0E75
MSDSSPFDSAFFRQVLGQFPTGVTVVTAAGPEGPAGLAIGSFGSVSLDPPLVMFMPGKSSSSWPAIEAAGHFGVNILAADQTEMSNVFASRADDKFAGLQWSSKVTGAPIFDTSLAWIDCEIDQVVEAGDHWIVLGRVLDLGVQRDDVGPLVFLAGSYGTFEPLGS